MTADRTFVIGTLTLDAARFELRHADRVLDLQPKALEFLLYLVRHRERLVPKAELLREVWAGVVVTEASLAHAAMEARRALSQGCDGEAIRTVRGRGYRFVGPLDRALASEPAARAPSSSAPAVIVSEPTADAPSFIGRARELAVLRAQLDRAREGAGSLVLVTGEAGAGKSSLLRAFERQLRATDAHVSWGHCWEGDDAPTLWPWQQVVRALFSALSPTRTAAESFELSAIAPGLATRASSDRPSESSPAVERARLYDNVERLLRASSAERPLVLLFEDVHAADIATLLLLRYASRVVATLPILLVATVRDGELSADDERAAIIEGLTRGGCVDLRGFDEGEVRSLVGVRADAARIARELHSITAGNPLFLTELLSVLDAPSAGAVDELHARLPQRLAVLIRDRVQRLCSNSLAAIEAAAVLGRTIDLALLARCTDRSMAELRVALEPARSLRLLAHERDPAAPLAFAHDLVRRAIATSLAPTRAASLHRRAADALVERWSDDPAAPFAVIAGHYERSLDAHEQAAQFHKRAGERARNGYAFEDAVRSYARALVAIDQGACGKHQRSEALLSLADAQWRAGMRDESNDTVQRALSVARSCGAAESFARSALLFGEVQRESGMADPSLIATLEEAASKLDSTNQSLRAQVLARLAVSLQFTDSVTRRESLSDEAVSLAERSGDRTALARALIGRYWTFWARPDPREALRTVDRALAGIDRRDESLELEARLLRMTSLVALGEGRAFSVEHERYAALVERRGDPSHRFFAALYQAMSSILRGALDDAERGAHHALELGATALPSLAQQFIGAQLFAIRREQGRVDEVLPGLVAMADLMPSIHSWRAAKAFAVAEAEGAAAARDDFEVMARDGFQEVPRDVNWLGALFTLAHVATLLGDRERAAVLRTLLEPHAGQGASVGTGALYLGCVDHGLAMLSSVTGRFDDAAKHYTAARRTYQRLGATPLELRLDLSLADMLDARASNDDRAEATALRLQTAHTARERGLVAIERAANAKRAA